MTPLLNKIRESEREFDERWHYPLQMWTEYAKPMQCNRALKEFIRESLISIFEENLVRLRGKLLKEEDFHRPRELEFADARIIKDYIFAFNVAINAEIAYWEGIIKELKK